MVEDEQFSYSIFSILISLAYSYLELRHFSEALEYLNECIEYYNENPDTYFRRSQARIYNKFSDDESNLLALMDIQKAIKLKNGKCELYEEHLEKVENRIEERKNVSLERIEGNDNQLKVEIIQRTKTSYKVIQERNLNIADYLFEGDSHRKTQYKILKE